MKGSKANILIRSHGISTKSQALCTKTHLRLAHVLQMTLGDAFVYPQHWRAPIFKGKNTGKENGGSK
jgi:hypothetical protein